MLRRISLRWLFVTTWLMAFVATYIVRFYLIMRHGEQHETDWRASAIWATAAAGLIVMTVKDLKEEPTQEQLAALEAIFQAGPGTIGAVVVTKNGIPEVIATVRSREEYLELAGSRALPPVHKVLLPGGT